MKKKINILSLLMILTASLLLSACTPKAGNTPADNSKKDATEKGEKIEMFTKVKSKLSFEESITKIENFLKEKNIILFYTADHKKNAEESGLTLDNNKVLIFGDPKVGTLLMQDNPSIAYELPLKISIYQEGSDVFLLYKKPSLTANDYTLNDKSKEILTKMDGLFEAMAKQVQ